MIGEDKGQISLEYLLVVSLSLMLLIVFTLPLTETAIENTLDVSQLLNVKSGLSEISQAICQVYGEGQGSRQTVSVQSPGTVSVTVTDSYLSCNVKLKDGSSKSLRINQDSNIEKSALRLDKGENIIIVEWPQGSENMRIYDKLF